MNTFRLTTSSDGTQHASATDDGIRYDVYVIGGEPIPFKYMERATAAAIDGYDFTEAAKDSLASDGIDINAIDVIVTASEATSSAPTAFHPYSLNCAAIELINEHAAAIADILKEYQRNSVTTAVMAHVGAIKTIIRALHNHLNQVQI